jgi:EAL domain-containing protein (putative c-di-GMP-specific phosphodiesterase class I)/CheY-like chemotaxis protein
MLCVDARSLLGRCVPGSDAIFDQAAMTGHRLLIIDDDPSICALVARIATHAGFETIVAEGPDEFAERVRTWVPTHIVMDLQMPVVDGLELMSLLAREDCAASIILISGVGESVVNAARRVGTARGLNVTAALNKPFSSGELSAVLQASRKEDAWLTVTKLAAAMTRQELYLLYQPKVDLRAGTVSGAEALVRWRHPVRGDVAPLEFIPFAESSACIDRMTQWIATSGFAQVRAWHALGCRLDLAINVSARNLYEPRLAEQLDGECRMAGVEPSQITLELTETAAMRDAVQMMDVLTRLRVKGFRLSIDDFGSGYSSLVQLHRLPFNEIKIDRTFVAGCTTSSESRSIVRLVIDLAHALGMKAVAEGVETPDTLTLLRDLGCDEAQGSFIAPPLDATEVPMAMQHHAGSPWHRAGAPWPAPPA